MTEQPTREFGKRRPVAIETPAPAKRSSHVALLVMGTLAVGAGAYALMPGENCKPNQPEMAGPSTPPATSCPPHRSSSGGGHGYWGSSWGRSWSSSSLFAGDSTSPASSESESGRVTRGGFGSFARAFTAHFSGGG